VKTDRRDATKLARSYRAGDLTAVWVPNEEHEALRDLVRAREVAKQDQLRARNRLSKFLLRHGRRAPTGVKAWTQKFQEWIKEQVHFEQPAQEYTLLDYLHEVEHVADRIRRLEQAIVEAVKLAPPQMQEVIQSLQALRGIAQISAVYPGGGVRRDLALRGSSATDGLQWCGSQRRLQRKANPARADHQDRQCSPAADCDRGGVGLPAPTSDRADLTQNDRRGSVKKSKKSPGRRNTGCISVTAR